MGFIAAVVGGLLGAAASAVGAIAAGIASTIATVVAPLVASVASVVGTVTGVLASTIARVVTPIAATLKTITTSVNTAIANIGKYIDDTTKPILDPIRESWKSIKEYLDELKEPWKPLWQPVKEIADVVNTVTDVKIMGQLLTGSEGIAKIVKYAEDGKLLDMAAAISTTYQMIAKTTTGILERANAEYKSFSSKMVYFDNSMRNLIHLTQSKTLETMYAKVKEVTGQVVSAFAEIDKKVSAIGRRTEDLSLFQTMLIRALR